MSIDEHEFNDNDISIIDSTSDLSVLELAVDRDSSGFFYLEKEDAIALAKHFKLNAHDIDCSEFKALQDDSNAIDEAHFDECAKLRTQVAELNRKLTMKGVN